MAPAAVALQAGPLPARRATMTPVGLPTPRGLLVGTGAGARGEHTRRHLPRCAAARRYRPYSPGSEPPPNGQWEPPSAKQKEPFDMELTVLFGLPMLVLLLPWVLAEPTSLVFLLPLLVLIPGPRDIALAVGKGMVLGASRARDFISRPQPREAGPRGGSSQQGVYGQNERSWQPGEPAAWADVPTAPYNSSDEPSQSGDSEDDVYISARWRQRMGQAAGAAPPAPWGGAFPGGGSGMRPRTVAAAAVPADGGRLVRPAGRGRVGVNIRPGSGTPTWMRALLAVFPWLRSWGGFI